MSTFTIFTITVLFTDFSAENWEALIRDSTNPENTSWDEVEMLMLQNVHQGTTHTLKNYVDQVLNGAINHYNGALTTTYNRIATLEAEVTCLQEKLTRLPCHMTENNHFNNIISFIFYIITKFCS